MSTLASVFGYGLLSARPAASVAGRFYYATDTTFIYRDNGSTWDTLSVGAGSMATDALWDAAGDLAVGTGANTAAKLGIGTAAYGLVSTGSTAAWAEILPWHVQIIPMIATPDATTGTWANTSNTENATFPFVQPGATNPSGGVGVSNASAVAVNDAWAIDVVLAAGTWDCHVWVRKSTNTGIITLNQDGASQGTVDTYAAAAAQAKVSVTGWTVASTGKKRMQLKMATKNGSSSNFVLTFYGLEFRRTA